MADQKPIRRVVIKPGCITCGLCEFIAPEVFEVTDVSRVRDKVDFSRSVDVIEQAVESCPVQVIVTEKE